MDTNTLLAISPLDGRYQSKLTSLQPIFSEFGLIKFRVLVEVRWLEMLIQYADLAKLPQDAEHILANLIKQFSPEDALRIKQIEATTNHDVKAVEYWIKEQIAHHAALANISEFIHFGCTSEDINNLAYGLMLAEARKTCLMPTLNALIAQMRNMAHLYDGITMLARTHGQPATPTTLGKELANFIARLERQLHQLATIPIFGKLNGASGNYNALVTAYPEIDWQRVSKELVEQLGLTWNPYTTQIEPHDGIAELFAVLVRINTILIDFNRDIWSYIAIHYFQQKSVAHEVGSSTMPHKINPIDFENAEGNLGLANALLEHMALKLPISRWQRDLSDSTVLRNMGVAVGHALLAYQSTQRGLLKLEPNQAIIRADLDQHWEVLAEPIQTVMRRYHIEQPYEKLKALTRGKTIDKTLLHQFISELALPENIKEQLYQLTPENYIGYAKQLGKQI